MGLDSGHIYITTNMFTTGSSPIFKGTKVWVINKGTLPAGGALTASEFNKPGLANGFAWQPAHAFGPGAVDYIISEGWSIGGTTRAMRIKSFTFPTSTPILTDLGFIQVADYGFDIDPNVPTGAPQPGCAPLIDTGDTRLINAVLRYGHLWTTNAVDDPVQDNVYKTEVAWYEIDPAQADANATNGPIQQGRVSNANRWYYFPSIAVNVLEDVALGFAASGPADFASGYYTMRLGTDSPGTIQPESLLHAGISPYFKDLASGKNRWGDYSATVVDPQDDINFWTIQEFADAQVGACPFSDTGRWGTWWGRFRRASCVDVDGDGYYDCGLSPGPLTAVEDCNDANANVHPGAAEVCGVVDTDCDGVAGNVGGDLDGSKRADGRDLYAWALVFGTSLDADHSTLYFQDYDPVADTDRDGDVDGVDLLALEADFGKTVCP